MIDDLIRISDRSADLEEALDLLDEVMDCDKGMHEEEWIEFCNRILPFMKKYGRQRYTLEYS